MALLKIEFTDDMIQLIRALHFDKLKTNYFVSPMHNDTEITETGTNRYNIIVRTEKGLVKASTAISIEPAHHDKYTMYGVDSLNLWGGTYVYEDMALILGKMDKIIPGTEENPTGPEFDEETLLYFNYLLDFLTDNMVYIESILHQFCTEGLQTDCIYVSKPNELIWTKKPKE